MSIKIFLSATFVDLKAERAIIVEAFRRLRIVEGLDVDLLTMEDFGFSSEDALTESLEVLEKADAYLGLLGYRYGSVPRGRQISYTEAEYRQAHKLKLPIYVLERGGLAGPDGIETEPAKLGKLNRLKKHARDNHLVLSFQDPSDLGKVIAQYLPARLRLEFPFLDLPQIEDQVMVPYFPLRSRSILINQDRDPIRSVDVLSISASGILGDRGLLENFLKRGCRFRFLNISRGGLAERLMAEGGGKGDIGNELKRSIERARRVLDIASLAGAAGSLELRELDWLPSATLFLIDVGYPEAIGWVGTYTPDIFTAGSEKWMVELNTTTSGDALNFYADQFNRLWKRSQSCLDDTAHSPTLHK